MAKNSKGAAADRLASGWAALEEARWDDARDLFARAREAIETVPGPMRSERWLACVLPVGEGIALAARR